MTLELTDSGKELLNLTLSGEATVNFCAVAIGSGTEGRGTALTEEQIRADISSIDREDEYVTLTALFDNSAVASGFACTELGVFADDPEDAGTPLLYAYAYADADEADYMPSTSDAAVEIEQKVFVYIGKAEAITATIDSRVAASAADLKAHIEDTDNPHSVTCSQIGAAEEEHTHTADEIVSGTLTLNTTGNAATATALETARTIRTNLASTTAASFDGSENITPGVTGVLPLANGGTGTTTGHLGITQGADTTSTAAPAFGGTFTAVDGIVKDSYGHTTSANTKTVTIPSTAATTSAAGLMSASDKAKLDGVATGANAYTHPTVTASDTTSTASPAHSGTFTAVDSVTRDSSGHVTGVNTKTITLPSDNNTDTKVTQTLTSSNVNYPLLLAPSGQTATATTTANFGTAFQANPSTGTLTATTFSGALSGNAATATSAASATSATTATKLNTARTIDGVSFDGSAAIIHYGTCSTAADTAAKVVSCTGFSLATGARIAVKFSYNNTEDAPTLNVNDTGAVAIVGYGTTVTNVKSWSANSLVEFIYDGTSWVILSVGCEGYTTTASGVYSHAEGYNTKATGESSHAEGSSTTASGDYSHAEGYDTTASGGYSHAEGYSTAASGNLAHAEGYSTKAAGNYSHAEGNNATASGQCGHAEGDSTTAQGKNSHAEGDSTTAGDIDTHAEGYTTEASGWYSHAENYKTVASGTSSHAENSSTTASGVATHAEGVATTASNYASHAGGKYNSAMTTGGAELTQVGDVFVIGNGTGSDALGNAFRVTYAGAVYGLSAFNSSGADYAEFILPWSDGNPDAEDRVGYFVTIDGDSIRKAQSGEYIAGITSGNPSVVGNGDETYYWKYERDEFDRIVWEDVAAIEQQTDEDGNPVTDENGDPVMAETGEVIENGRMKLSDDYDATQTYIPRKDRPEWDYVGMVGVLPVRDDGTCVAGGWCCCGADGIGTAAESRGWDTYYVIERISDSVVRVVLK